LSNGSSVTLTVTVIIEKAGLYPNSAIVTGDQNDTNSSNNNASSDNVTVSEKPIDNATEEVTTENTTDNVGDVEVAHEEVPLEASHRTGNPIFMALFVILSIILIPLRRRD
jgi:hypothetical protein